MTIKETEAIGYFLANYYSDLDYIRQFQGYRKGLIAETNFSDKFYTFLTEFGIIRNIPKGLSANLLKLTRVWLDNSANPDNVDGFANHLKEKGMTRGNVATSLCSKILFLNNPWKIIPMDSRGKEAVGQKQNDYASYRSKVIGFQKKHNNIIESNLKRIESYVIPIEQDFKGEVKNIETIRKNRFTDKLLWVNLNKKNNS